MASPVTQLWYRADAGYGKDCFLRQPFVPDLLKNLSRHRKTGFSGALADIKQAFSGLPYLLNVLLRSGITLAKARFKERPFCLTLFVSYERKSVKFIWTLPNRLNSLFTLIRATLRANVAAVRKNPCHIPECRPSPIFQFQADFPSHFTYEKNSLLCNWQWFQFQAGLPKPFHL